MTQIFENTKFGDVTVRNVMIDTDGTNLEEGLEFTVPNVSRPIEVYGYHDLEELTVTDVEDLLEDNY